MIEDYLVSTNKEFVETSGKFIVNIIIGLL